MDAAVGIPLVGYSPLGRGFLGRFKKVDDLPADDLRRRYPRFQPGVFNENMKLTRAVEEMAARKGVSVAQVAIAWVRAQGAIPIPGSTSPERVVENCKPLELSEPELAELDEILKAIPVHGDRYGADQQKYLHQ
jgi:pyridoxine 4-dehydrogenase